MRPQDPQYSGDPSPSQIRAAFLRWIESDLDLDLSDPRLEMLWRIRLWTLAQMLDCSDVLTDRHCRKLGLPPDSSYAQAARVMLGLDENT
jgi:hypothetical protein